MIKCIYVMPVADFVKLTLKSVEHRSSQSGNIFISFTGRCPWDCLFSLRLRKYECSTKRAGRTSSGQKRYSVLLPRPRSFLPYSLLVFQNSIWPQWRIVESGEGKIIFVLPNYT